jgi:hypothetical protein
MEFNITMEISLRLGQVSAIANTLASQFNDHIKDKYFGTSVKQIIMSLVCIEPEYEDFFKIRKPKFVNGKKNIKKHGTEYEIDSLLTYDLKLDFQKVIVMHSSEIEIYLRSEMSNSLSVVKNIKFEDFDILTFGNELSSFLGIVFPK